MVIDKAVTVMVDGVLLEAGAVTLRQLTQSCWDKRINRRSECHMTKRKTCKRQVFIVKIMAD